MSVAVKTGDYVILQVNDKKKGLARVVSADRETRKYKALLEGGNKENEVSFDFKLREVIANLGTSPGIGKAYGVNIEPLREVHDRPFWGPVSFYREVDDDYRKRLFSRLKAVAAALQAKKYPVLELNTEIRSVTGKYAGYYKFRPKVESDILCIRPDDTFSSFEYIASHEYAHGLWFRCFTPKMRMAWIKLYHEAITLNQVGRKDLEAMLDDLARNGDLYSYAKEIDGDQLLILNAVFKHMKSVHSIEKKHFQLALTLGDDISPYWPSAVELSEKKLVTTDYAQKSPEEFWAEAFSLRFAGKKLPSRVEELLSHTVRRLVK